MRGSDAKFGLQAERKHLFRLMSALFVQMNRNPFGKDEAMRSRRIGKDEVPEHWKGRGRTGLIVFSRAYAQVSVKTSSF